MTPTRPEAQGETPCRDTLTLLLVSADVDRDRADTTRVHRSLETEERAQGKIPRTRGRVTKLPTPPLLRPT